MVITANIEQDVGFRILLVYSPYFLSHSLRILRLFQPVLIFLSFLSIIFYLDCLREAICPITPQR